ncbi:MAG: hypothetical protein D6722_16015, partial [Bacteroidetes bacterium]
PRFFPGEGVILPDWGGFWGFCWENRGVAILARVFGFGEAAKKAAKIPARILLGGMGLVGLLRGLESFCGMLPQRPDRLQPPLAWANGLQKP